MIIGLGTDLCDIRRIQKTLVRFGDRFINKVFDQIEREKAEKKIDPAFSYAQSFAAKEACAKALGTGLREGVFWRDMGVRNLESGRPFMEIRGGAYRRLQFITPPGMKAHLNISQSDEYPMAHAVVIISAYPKQELK